jgi:hypothetical protein
VAWGRRGVGSPFGSRNLVIRPPEQLRDWLLDYASRHERPVRAVVTEALEEYRVRHEREADNMRTVTTAHARDYLQRAFTYNSMRPDQMAGVPIRSPGIAYSPDGTLTDSMKARATEHLIGVLRDNGYLIRSGTGTDATAALHHVLWANYTVERLTALGYTLRSYTIQEDGPQQTRPSVSGL